MKPERLWPDGPIQKQKSDLPERIGAALGMILGPLITLALVWLFVVVGLRMVLWLFY